MRGFDVEDYLVNNHGARQSGTKRAQLVMTCPRCGGEDRLYVNVEDDGDDHPRGAFICYRCDNPPFRGRSFAGLFAELEGVDLREARHRMLDSAGISFGRSVVPPPPVARRAALKHAPRARLGGGQSVVQMMQELIPEFEPCWRGENRYQIPRYLKQRKVPSIVCQLYDIGFATHGRFHDRIILPVVMGDGSVDYTARSTLADEEIRYLSGPYAGSMVYGWRQASWLLQSSVHRESGEQDYVVIVEGPFDVLGFARVGVPAVGLLGKSTFSREKFEMARSTGAKRLLLCLDAGERDAAVADAIRTGVQVEIIEDLEGFKDPGEAPDEVLLRAVRRSTSVSDAWARGVRDRLSRLRS